MDEIGIAMDDTMMAVVTPSNPLSKTLKSLQNGNPPPPVNARDMRASGIGNLNAKDIENKFNFQGVNLLTFQHLNVADGESSVPTKQCLAN